MEDRRGKIIEAATHRFAQNGFEITTVRELADDVKIMSGSLYYHFSTKEEILHAIVGETAEKMRDNAIRIAQEQVDPEHQLVAFVMLNIYELVKNQPVFSILYSERKFFRKVPEFAYIIEAKRQCYLACRSIIERGKSEGFFDPDLDVYMAITIIIRTLNMAADWYRNEDVTAIGLAENYDLSEVVDFLLRLVLRAVRSSDRVTEPIPREACEKLARFQSASIQAE